MPEKSAEEWKETLLKRHGMAVPKYFIREVQRNAKHAAMLEAAEIVSRSHCGSENCDSVSCAVQRDNMQAIFTAAKKYED